ncbi:MAG: GFA family protein [SAR324 cluster bacterium]|nr:GFA family protein [SAR324 cluster bacterium]
MIKHQGGCHCGQIRFSTEYDPMLVFQCNCQRCRRMTGSISVGAMYGVPEIEITGTPKEYVTPGGSGMPVRYFFCAECGTRVYAIPEAIEGFMGISLGAFDDPMQFEPKGEIFAKYKMPWLRDSGCIQESFEEGAVTERMQMMLENLDQRG